MSETRRRSRMVNVRLLPAEYRSLKAAAEELGLSMQEFVRQAIFVRATYHNWVAVGREPWVCVHCGKVDDRRESPPIERCDASSPPATTEAVGER